MIRLRVLGPVELINEDGVSIQSVLTQPKRLALFAYLALENPGGFHRRDTLLALFWPESDTHHARAALSQALYFLRRSLGEEVIVSRGDEEIGVDSTLLQVDAVELARAAKTGNPDDILELYRGPLLDGFHAAVGVEFEHWLDRRRAEVQQLVAAAAAAAAEAPRSGSDRGTGPASVPSVDPSPGEGEPAGAPGAPDRLGALPLRQPWRRGVLLALVLALLVVGWWAATQDGRASTIRSLAVLPLEDRSNEAEGVYFVAFVQNAIITELSQITALRVISAASTERYRTDRPPIPVIAEELGVDAVVQGAVVRTRDSLTVYLQLIEAKPRERQVWAMEHSGDAGSLSFAPAAARSLADRLHVPVTAEEAARLGDIRTSHPEAVDLYARGRHYWSQFTPEAFERAIESYSRALERDPHFAPAHAALADVYNAWPYYAPVPPSVAFPLAKVAAARALELDPRLGPAHSALGWSAATHQWDWAAAERHFRRALEISPSYAHGHMQFAAFLIWLGRSDEALWHEERARALDPLSPRVLTHVGLVHHCAREYDRAISVYREALDRYPGFAHAYFDLSRSYSETGRHEEAIAAAEEGLRLSDHRAGGGAASIAELGYAYARAGDRAPAVDILRRLEADRRQHYVSPLSIARIHAALGETDAALEWIETAVEERDGDVIFLAAFPAYDPVRSDPRFDRILRRVGFPERRPPS